MSDVFKATSDFKPNANYKKQNTTNSDVFVATSDFKLNDEIKASIEAAQKKSAAAASIPDPIDVSKGLIQTPREYVSDIKNTQTYRERASQSSAELSLTDRLNLDGAKKKYVSGAKLSIPEVAAVLRYSKNLSDFSGTEQQGIGTTLADLTGKEIKKQGSPLETFADKAKAPIVEPMKDIVDKFVTALDEKSVSYLDKNEQDEYNRKKAVDEIAAVRYLESKSDKIAMRQGVEMAQNYINGNFGEKAINGLNIWIGTGVSDVGWGDSFTAFESMITGKDMPKSITTPEEYANAYLANYFAENGKWFEKAIQDIVVNTANNMIAGAPGAVMSTLTQNKTIGETIGRISFALSVFGNTYRNEVENGYNSKKAALYAVATTAAEISLESVLGAIPGVGGEFVEGLGKKCGNAVGRFFIKMLGNAAGEYIEEGTQTLLDPFLRRWILGEDVKTVANDMKNQLNEANYSGIIGAISSLFMSGFGTVADIRTERNIENYGKMYKEILAQTDSTVKDLANYGLAVADKKSEFYKTAKDIVDGKAKETDYNVGKLYVEAVSFFESANIMVNSFTGSNIKQKENGVQNLLADFDSAVSEGAVFNDVITLKADKIRQSIANGTEISDYDIGAFARTVEFNAPAAYIQGKVNQTLNTSNPELQLNANGDTVVDEVGDDGVAVNSQLPSGENRDADTKNGTVMTGEISGTDVGDTYARADGQGVFREPSTKEIYRPWNNEDYRTRMLGGDANSKMKQVEDLTAKLGMKMRWVTGEGNGYYERETNTIALNPELTLTAAYIQIYKHEFCHRLESKKLYNSFFRYVYEDSRGFVNYCRDRYEKKNGRFEGSDAKAIEWAVNDIYILYEKELPARERGKLDEYYAKQELLADFVGDVLLNGQDINAAMQSLTELAEKNRTVFEQLRDFIREILAKIKGDPHYLTLEQDLEYLNKYIARVYHSTEIKNTAKDSGARYSISTDSQGNYVKIDTRQDIFNEKNTREMQEIARKVIRDNFKGMVLSVGEDGKAYINKRSADEYAYPANRRMDENIKESKMRAAPELDNLLAVSKFIENQPDDGRHPQATGGWDVYSTRFEVAGTMFTGEVKVMVTDRGYVFYDITKIKRLPVNGGQTEINSVAASGNLSTDIISEKDTSVNIYSTQESGNYSENALQRKYSLARSYDKGVIAEAEKMERENKERDQIFESTGLVRDPKGIWLYDLDDSRMKFYPNGDALKRNDSDYLEYLKLNKKVNSYREIPTDENGDLILTKGQEKVFERWVDLQEILEKRYNDVARLKDYVVYDELFEKYPQIADATFAISDLSGIDALGCYYPNENIILIDRHLYEVGHEKYTVEDVLVHEIQHALQTFDERQNGSSVDFWTVKLSKEGHLPYSDFLGRELVPDEAYQLTAGEIEAKAAEERRELPVPMRNLIAPDLGWEYAIYPDEKQPVPSRKYSFSSEVRKNAPVIDLSRDNELSQRIGDKTGASKYKEIQNYILETLAEQPVTLSDGRKAIVDRSDALHIANKSVDKKTAQISQIKAIVENAAIYAEDDNVQHKKFDYFCYYRTDVKYGKDTFPIYLNVGKGINDKLYHIYDITNKIRDTAHRINGVERPKPNEGYALQTISLDNSIPDDGKNVKRKYSLPSDNEYFATIKSGDIAAVQKMVDGAAQSRGYTERLYHQTGTEFTEFNTDNQKAGKYDHEMPTGIFLKPTDKDIGLAGKKQMELYARFNNPLNFATRHTASAYFKRNIPEYANACRKIDDINREYRLKSDDANRAVTKFMTKWRSSHPNSARTDIYKDSEFQELHDREQQILEEWEAKSDMASLKAKELINDYIADSEYDGVVVDLDVGSGGRYTKTYIAFDSAQLKSAAPVTYDDNGEIIPLSERFNRENKDIRWSMKEISADFGDIQKFSGKILRQNHSAFSKAELTDILNEVLEFANNSDYGRAMHRATDAARSIIEASKDTQQIADDAQEILSEIRTTAIRLTSTQKLEAGYAYGGYSEFYKRNFGRLKITDNGLLLEKKWQEWCEQYPDLFDSDMVAEDMPVALANIVENLKGQYIDYDIDAAVESLASQIFNEAFNRRGSYTNEELLEYDLKLRQKHKAEVSGLYRQLSESERKVKRQKRLLDERNQNKAQMRREERAKVETRITKQKTIEQIRRDVKRIEKTYRANSEKKHVPEKLKGFIKEFCRVFVREDTSVFDRLDLHTVCNLYSRLGVKYNGEEPLTTYDEEIRADLDELAEIMDGKTLRELNFDELLTVKKIVENVSYTISYENTIFMEDRAVETSVIADDVSKELGEKKTRKEFFALKGRSLMDIVQTPEYFFERMGKTLKSLFDEVKKGEGKWAWGMEKARAVIADIKSKYHYDDWAEDKPLKFTTQFGDVIEITREQAMLIYATAKRQASNKTQGAEHVNIGGFVLVNDKAQKVLDRLNSLKVDKDGKRQKLKVDKDGKRQKLKADKDGKRQKLKDAFFDEVDSSAHPILPEDFATITEWLTDEQRGYADAMVEYLSKDMAKLGNETSMILFGFEKFTEEYYIPYTSAPNFLSWQIGVQDAASLKHIGFTRDLTKGANNPLLLLDFSEVCANHIEQMLRYNAMAVPIDNLTRVINSKTSGIDGNRPRAIKTDIERVMGKNGTEYIKKLLDDTSGSVRRSSAEDVASKWLGRFKKNAVMGNLSVVVQQPTAIARAFLYIPAKYFVKTSAKFAEQSFEQMKEYVPEAIIKEMGGHDMGLGASNFDYLFRPKKTVMQRIDDVTSYAPAKADAITWGQIWAAAKAYIADTTEFEVGTEEFYKAAGEFCSSVINKTQVYDSTLTRSEIMRDKGMFAKMVTAFMSEPILTLNVLGDAAYKAKSGQKGGKKFLAAAVGCFVLQVAYNAAIKSIVYAMRDDDEDETYLEKYLQAYTEAVLDDMNIMSYVPFINDILSQMKGYEITRTDMDVFSTLIDAVQGLANEDTSVYKKFASVAGALGLVFGIPVKNIERDMRGIYTTVYNGFKGKAGKNSAEGIGRAIKTGAGEALNWLPFVEIKTNETAYYEDLAEAALDNDERAYQKAYKQLIDMGVEEKDIRSGIKSAYSEMSEEETEDIVAGVRKNKTYSAFDDDDKESYEKKVKSLLANQKTEKALGNIEMFDKLYEYKRTSETKYKEYKKELVKQGLTDSQISDGIELARLAYMKSVGIDIHEYVLYKIAMSKKNADTDESGGVSRSEKRKAIDKMDVSNEVKRKLKDMD